MISNKLIPTLRFPEFVNEGEWEEKELQDTCDINPTTSNLPEKFVYIDLESVENGKLLQKRFINSQEAPSRAQRLLKDDDVIFQMVRPYQKNNYYFKKVDDFDYVASTGYAQLRAFESSMYLYQFMHTDSFISNVLKRCTGSNYPAINSSDLSKILVQIPKPLEQQKIAACLSSLDELITAHSQKLELLKSHKKGLMQNLFPQKSESGFTRLKDDRMKDEDEQKILQSQNPQNPDSDNIPKYRFNEFENDGEWVEKELDDFCYRISSGKDKNVEGGEFELYGSTGIIGKTESASYQGDYILVARVGANAGFVNRAKGSFGVTDNTIVLDLKNIDTIDFIHYSLEKIGLNKLVFGSGQPLITGGQLKKLILFAPESEEEQQKIASCLSAVDALITAQAEKIEQLQLHKKGLMQGLFPKVAV